MKIWLVAIAVLGSMATTLCASPDPAEIKIRDVDFKGLMVVNSDLSLTLTFDVKGEDAFDELVFDFYIQLTPREKEQGEQFFHCRTIHRYLEKESGYTTGVILGRNAVKCINPRASKYAVVVSQQGKEIGVENSEDERWWEDASLGHPIENVLWRSSGLPLVREWESRN